jgi:hypothetical protein
LQEAVKHGKALPALEISFLEVRATRGTATQLLLTRDRQEATIVDRIKKLRETFRLISHLTLDYNFDRREYDDLIKIFKRGDSFTLSIEVHAVPNDIIWANLLDDGTLTQEMYKKILDLKKKFDK